MSNAAAINVSSVENKEKKSLWGKAKAGECGVLRFVAGIALGGAVGPLSTPVTLGCAVVKTAFQAVDNTITAGKESWMIGKLCHYKVTDEAKYQELKKKFLGTSFDEYLSESAENEKAFSEADEEVIIELINNMSAEKKAKLLEALMKS